MIVDLTGLDALDFDAARKRPLGNFARRVPFSDTERGLVLSALDAGALLDPRARMARDVLGAGTGRTRVTVKPCTKFPVGTPKFAPPVPPPAVMSAIGLRNPASSLMPVRAPANQDDGTVALGIDVDVAGGVGAGVGMGIYGGTRPTEVGTYLTGNAGLFLMCGVNGAVQMTIIFGPPSLFSGASVTATIGIEFGTYIGFSAGPSGALIFSASLPVTIIGITFGINLTGGISLPLSLSVTVGYTSVDPILRWQ